MSDELRAVECDLCGDQPKDLHLRAKCHLTAPLRAILSDGHLELRCYAPECDRLVTRLKLADPAPIDMVLPCPRCGKLHIIDAPEPETGWTNPSHRSHLCAACGLVWRPADVPTNGVAAAKTRGERDGPADDGEPITPAWLGALGGVHGTAPAGNAYWDFAFSEGSDSDGDEYRDCVRIHDPATMPYPDVFATVNGESRAGIGLTGRELRTRGDVRRLLDVLGITPKE